MASVKSWWQRSTSASCVRSSPLVAALSIVAVVSAAWLTSAAHGLSLLATAPACATTTAAAAGGLRRGGRSGVQGCSAARPMRRRRPYSALAVLAAAASDDAAVDAAGEVQLPPTLPSTRSTSTATAAASTLPSSSSSSSSSSSPLSPSPGGGGGGASPPPPVPTVVVAGASGYIGRAVVAELVARGVPTQALVRNAPRLLDPNWPAYSPTTAACLDGADVASCDVLDSRGGFGVGRRSRETGARGVERGFEGRRER